MGVVWFVKMSYIFVIFLAGVIRLVVFIIVQDAERGVKVYDQLYL